jgi:PAS domain S-box-containing protein
MALDESEDESERGPKVTRNQISRFDSPARLAHGMGLALMALAAVGVFLSAAAFYATFQYRNSTHRANETHRFVEKTAELLSTVKDAETGQRGYLLTRQEIYLDPFLAANDQINRQLQELRALASTTTQRQDVERLAVLVSEKLAELSETVRLSRGQGFQAALALVLTGRGNLLMLALRHEVDEARAKSESLLIAQRLAQSRCEWELLFAAGSALLAVSLLAAFARRRLRDYNIHQQAGALQKAIFSSPNFSCIATDAKGVIQLFNVGAERMFGYTVAEVTNKITPADLHDPQEVIARAAALSLEFSTVIAPGFEALAFKASRGIEDVYEVTKVRKDGSRFPAVLSVTALRDDLGGIIGYLLIATDNTVRKHAEEALLKAGALQDAVFSNPNFSCVVMDTKGIIQICSAGIERMLGVAVTEMVGAVPPGAAGRPLHLRDAGEEIARAAALSIEFSTPIAPGFEALVFKASRGIEDTYELTYNLRDGRRFPAVVSVTALRDDHDGIIGYLVVVTDNTARKRTEVELLKASALQNAIFTSAHFSCIATDERGVIQLFNVGAERMLGYTASEVVNKITPAVLHDPEEVIARAKALSVELGTPITPGFDALVFKASRGIEDIYELTKVRKDGSRLPAVVSVTALRDDHDRIIGYLLIGTDNTARKQAEEALLKAGALQNAIFNSENFSSIATDEKGVIQLFNVGAERMLGYAAIEVVDKITPADISDPQEVIARAKALSDELATTITPGFDALAFKASRGIEDIYELTYFRKDGSRFPAVVSVTALRDPQGGIIGYLLIGTDNTARKQAEAEQKQLDQRLRDQQFYTRSLIESSIDALMTTDPAGIITDANKQMEALTGCTRDELIGAPFKNCFTDPERAEAGIRQVLSGGKVTDYELTARARDGKETVVSYNATTFHDRYRKLQGVFAAARDVTERKRIEGKLQENNLEMERAKTAAETANLAKSDFLTAMSHEIRTPMNAILGMADMLWESQLDADQMHYVEVFRRAGSSLLLLINDILDLSKIEAGHLDLESVEFDLEEVVDQAIELTAVKARAKGILLLFRLVPGLTTALIGDASRLKQILINLLGNAVKFTESGEVMLTVENHESGKSGEIEFSVSDTGVGIPAGKLETIFDDFTQADASTTRKYGGTGLGLGISRRLVESMKGSLTAASSLGEGSTFRFNARFDLAPPSHRKIRVGHQDIRPQDIRGRRVLVIDDNPTNCLILHETLQGWGSESDVFGLPEKALAGLAEAMASEQPYSLVLVDSRMPKMDGFETAAEIRQIAPDLPVVMLTSDARPGDGARRKEAGLSGYAVKPLKSSDLLRLVCGAMNPLEGPDVRRLENVNRKKAEPAKPMRILVAEDSSDNRLLLQAYMKGSPHLLTFAEDGKVAVAHFAAADFDLVLMDIQMPVMDGLTATRAIRAIERTRGTVSTPIVALTANAGPQDVETSRHAGCNDHLSKPISKHTLLSLIEEYGTPRRTPGVPAAGSLQPIVIETPLGLEEIVPGYLAARREELLGMMALLAASDFKSLAVLGHNLKGSGASYGFADLTRIGIALEQSANQTDTGALGAQLADLKDYLARVELFAKV